MSLASFSVKRPCAILALVLVLLMLGGNSYRKLSVDLMPSINVPYIFVRTEYQGASPEEIEVEVARRIEDAVASIDGLLHTSVTCMENECHVSLEFSMQTNVDVAATDVREQLNRIRDDFPDGVKEPTIRKVDNNATNVATIMLVGSSAPDELFDYADYVLADRFSSVPGVGQVRVDGANDMQVHIFADPLKLRSANLTIDDLAEKIRAENVKIPAGRIRSGDREVNLTFDGEFKSFDDILGLEVGKYNGKRVYFRDVAEVRLVSREVRSRCFFNDRPAALINVIKKGEANAVEVISGLQARFRQMQNELPGGYELIWFNDSGRYISASVDDAWNSIALGILLTAALLLFFLHELRTTLIVVISMPVSVVITFLVMQYLNYSFNTMTLLSLGCSVGVLVTNSIVVIENIFKCRDRGDSAVAAAASGTGEVAAAVAASALTNVVVFVPVAMMTSRTGRMLAPFAGVMVAATLVSLFISFSVTPIFASFLLKQQHRDSKKMRFFRRLFVPWDIAYDFLCRHFERSISLTRKHSLMVVLTVTAIAAAVGIFAVPRVGLSFFPKTDQGEITVRIEFPTSYNIDATARRTRQLAAKIGELDFVRRRAVTIGRVSGTSGQLSQAVYLAQIMLVVSDKNERRESLNDLLKIIRDTLKDAGDCLITLSIPKVGSAGGGGYDIPFRISGDDIAVLEQIGLATQRKIRDLCNANDIDSSIREHKPAVNILPRRTILRNLGISASDLSSRVRGTYEGLEVGTYRIGNRSFDIRIKQRVETGMEQLENISVAVKQGNPLSIHALAEVKEHPMTVAINRYDKERSIWIYANTAPGQALGIVADSFQKTVSEMLPPGYSVRFGGQVERMGETGAEFVEVIILAILLTYLVIVAIMESWTRPLLIMFTIPLGFLGMYFTLFCFEMSMSMMGLLGGVMMIGIVVNNAILIIDDCYGRISAGSSSHEAMELACRAKFRPILMTSIAAVAGMLPMAFGTGLGSELRSSCGVGVVGGLLISSVLTVYTIPALYFLFVKDKKISAAESADRKSYV